MRLEAGTFLSLFTVIEEPCAGLATQLALGDLLLEQRGGLPARVTERTHEGLLDRERHVVADDVEELERLAPFGAGNSEPLFAFPSVVARNTRVIGTAHLQITLAGQVDIYTTMPCQLIQHMIKKMQPCFNIAATVAIQQ